MSSSPFIEFDDQLHRYYADGIEAISVTSVLKIAGAIKPAEYDEAAAWRGTEVHRLCDEFDRGSLDRRKVPQELRGYLRAYQTFRWQTQFEIQEIEQPIVSNLYNFGGRPDRRGLVKGQRAILDIKTSKSGSVNWWTALQLAGYGCAIEPFGIFLRYAVCLRPNGQYAVKQFPVTEYKADVEDFLAALRWARRLRRER